MMNESKILRTVVVAATSFGGLDVNVYYGPFWKDSTWDIVGAPGILEQEDTVRCRRSHLPVLFLVFVQLLKEIT
jgi:hypothetical protein